MCPSAAQNHDGCHWHGVTFAAAVRGILDAPGLASTFGMATREAGPSLVPNDGQEHRAYRAPKSVGAVPSNQI
jgi:hypothetical protein